MKYSVISSAISLAIAAGSLLAFPAVGQAQAQPGAAPSEISMERDAVVSSIDIRHLRGLAEAFGLETVLEERTKVLVAVRLPGEPVFNLLADACRSSDAKSECEVLIVRSLFDPKEKPFTPEMASKLNFGLPMLKALLLDDGRMQLDRVVFLGGGVTMGNLGDNIAVAYQSFEPANPVLYPEDEAPQE